MSYTGINPEMLAALKSLAEKADNMFAKEYVHKSVISRRGKKNNRLIRTNRSFGTYFRRSSELRRLLSDAKIYGFYIEVTKHRAQQ